MAIRASHGHREPGGLRGRVHLADDFDAPLPEEVARAFGGDGS